MNIPTQEQFNEDHKYPVDYGEDGDIAVGSNYTQAEAFEQFKQYWIDTNGAVPEYFSIKDVKLMDFGWSVNPDYAGEENEISYALLYDLSRTDTVPRFKGWVWQA